MSAVDVQFDRQSGSRMCLAYDPFIRSYFQPSELNAEAVCTFGRPFVKRFALCYRTVVLSVSK